MSRRQLYRMAGSREEEIDGIPDAFIAKWLDGQTAQRSLGASSTLCDAASSFVESLPSELSFPYKAGDKRGSSFKVRTAIKRVASGERRWRRRRWASALDACRCSS